MHHVQYYYYQPGDKVRGTDIGDVMDFDHLVMPNERATVLAVHHPDTATNGQYARIRTEDNRVLTVCLRLHYADTQLKG